ncbi:hypothetical protein [Pelosinus sp. sgz500959]|uniref:hypothetical protein n=1 Tax=Pelosinus sp. sgz500959 TaxID=3242472 RepID=UPI00366F2E48
MLTIDLIGLLITIFMIGLRYPHYVLLATCIHELGRIFATIAIHGQLDSIVTAGVFGTMVINHYDSSLVGTLLLFSGSLANYIVSSITGGIVFDSTKCLLNPLANLKQPFSVINFRLCILSFLVQTWKIFT